MSFKLTFAAGYTWDTVKAGVTKAVNDYFAALAKDWANQSGITVRVSQVETKVLSVDGVIDITGNEDQRRNPEYRPGVPTRSPSWEGSRMKLKDYWPRCLQDLVEFQQIANAEQPEFEKALGDVRTAADDFSCRPCPNMAVSDGKRSWPSRRPTGTPWKRAANES